MEIVPSGQPLFVEAQLPVELIDKVAVGLPVDLNFSAFNQSNTPGYKALYGASEPIVYNPHLLHRLITL